MIPESKLSVPLEAALPVLPPSGERPRYIVATKALTVPPVKSTTPLGALDAPVCPSASPCVHHATGLTPSTPRNHSVGLEFAAVSEGLNCIVPACLPTPTPTLFTLMRL